MLSAVQSTLVYVRPAVAATGGVLAAAQGLIEQRYFSSGQALRAAYSVGKGLF
jgi:hypothetical protein